MNKELNWLNNAKIQKKIVLARRIVEKMNKKLSKNDVKDLSLKLKEISDKAELIYNDAKIKSYKSVSALQEMHQCEKQLDKLLLEADFLSVGKKLKKNQTEA